VRHPAKRRQLKTVLQKIMYRVARVIEHARRMPWISIAVSSPICASLFTCRYRLHKAAKLLSQAASFATECLEGALARGA